MFERNIIDLVGLFVENVQSLYPFWDDPDMGGATCPGLQSCWMKGACTFNKRQERAKLLQKLSSTQISGVPFQEAIFRVTHCHQCPAHTSRDGKVSSISCFTFLWKYLLPV
jgi:hypothetical protein